MISILILTLSFYLVADEVCENIPYQRIRIFSDAEKSEYRISVDRHYGREKLIKTFKTKKDARVAKHYIVSNQFTKFCKIGEGRHSMEYWTK